jgi:nicotinate-nucleotide pyrophosphorylase (carboxylating)
MSANLNWTPAIGILIDLALQEDLAYGDLTTAAIGEVRQGYGAVMAKEELVCCGLPVVRWLVQRATPELVVEAHVNDGCLAAPGTELLRLEGPVDAILRIERAALNFLMRMSGVATLASHFAKAVAGTPAKVVDTRKTLPGWRVLDKYSTRVGGADNHRFDLASGILIKDNHIAACGSVGEAVRRAKNVSPHPLRIEVEVEDLSGVTEALEAGAEVLLLDNMSPAEVAESVGIIDGRALVEVSGGINLKSIRAYAEAGADLISVGALTHSAVAVDISLDLYADPPAA